jgi:hypothetical protein
MFEFALNLRRLMARCCLTLEQVVEASGLSERTVKSLLGGKNKPHARLPRPPAWAFPRTSCFKTPRC